MSDMSVGHGKCSGVCEFASVLKAQADDVTTPATILCRHPELEPRGWVADSVPETVHQAPVCLRQFSSVVGFHSGLAN